MTYAPPLSDLQAALVAIGAGRLAETARFAEATSETVAAVLEEAGRLAADVVAPLQRVGDLNPARLENGVVRTSPGFAEAYRAVAAGGWVGITADPAHGGMGLPVTLGSAVAEMMSAACMALWLNPLLTQGQIEALEAHAPDRIRDLYLPKLISGEWTGTMNLTEPQAGSDVGALRATAVPKDDGTYAVTGQKIYISWGDHDMAGNIVHLVLARLPDGAPGTRGISLFLVPKRIPDADGRPGRANRLRAIGLEHKTGLHASPTCVMEYDGATGWLIGPEHGGMACMFTMMNNARLAVGVQGVAAAEAACQMAAAHAAARRQGRTPLGDGPIAGHADVRRMLALMRTRTAAARAICLDCALALDMAKAAPEADRPGWAARAAFLTPIAKAFGTDTGIAVADLGIQVHGGMGYVEATGAAQLWRDARVTAIYEGTNGIQAIDLVGRKMADGGAMARALIGEMRAGAGAPLAAALDALAAATDWMLAADATDRQAGAVAYLTAFGLCLGTHHLHAAARALPGEPARAAMARIADTRLLPAVGGLCAEVCAGASALYADDAAALYA